MKLTSKIFIPVILLTATATTVFADNPPPDPTFNVTYGVSDWREKVPELAAEYKNYRFIVLSNTTYSDEEKAQKIAKKYSDIRTVVISNRTELYSKVSEKLGVGNSATKGSSGGTPKKVKAKCISASKPNMYTSAQWARGAYKSGDDDANANILSSGTAVGPEAIIIDNGTSVCAIALKQSGKGRKVSYSEATFYIRPAYIKTIVDTEALSIMYAISNTPI